MDVRGHLVLYVYMGADVDEDQQPIMCLDTEDMDPDTKLEVSWNGHETTDHDWCEAHRTSVRTDLPPTEPPLPEVRFLRHLAGLLETNEKSTLRHAEPGRLLSRLNNCLGDDDDTTISALISQGFHSGKAEETCADLGLLDGA